METSQVNNVKEMKEEVGVEKDNLIESFLTQQKATRLLNELYKNMVMRDETEKMAKYQLPQFVSVLAEDACSHVDEIIAEFEGKTGADIKEMDGKELKTRMIELLGAKETDLIFNMEEAGVKEAIGTIVEAANAMEEVDSAIAEVNEEMQKIKTELVAIIGEDDVPTLIKRNLERIVTSNDPEILARPKMKKQAQVQLDAIEEVMTLNKIKDLYAHVSPANALKDFKDAEKKEQIRKQYTSAMKMMGLKSSIGALIDFEKKFLPEEYAEKNNLFVFIVMRYVAAKQYSTSRDELGMFVMQLTSIMCTFYTETVSETVREQFIRNVKDVLDLF